MTEFGNPNLKASHSMSSTGNIDKSMNQNKYRRGELKIVVIVTKRNKKLISIRSYFSLQLSLICCTHRGVEQRETCEQKSCSIGALVACGGSAWEFMIRL